MKPSVIREKQGLIAAGPGFRYTASGLYH